MSSNWVTVAIVTAVFLGGWKAHEWYADSKALAEQKALAEAIAAFERRESSIADAVEQKLEQLKANERVIEKHRQKVIERPVYRNVCIDDDGLRLLNSYATGDTAEPAPEVPRDTSSTHR